MLKTEYASTERVFTDESGVEYARQRSTQRSYSIQLIPTLIAISAIAASIYGLYKLSSCSRTEADRTTSQLEKISSQ